MRIEASLCLIPFFLVCACSDSAPPQEETACAILEDFVGAELRGSGRSIFLREMPSTLLQGDAERLAAIHLSEVSEESERLDEVVIAEFERLSQVSPVSECEGLASLKSELSYSPANPEEPPEITEDGLFFAYESLTVQLPVVDADTGVATFYVSRACGPLCGGTQAIIYRRDEAGNWRQSATHALWIS